MKTKMVLLMVLAAALIFLFSPTVVSAPLDKPNAPPYDVDNERTFVGMVARSAHAVEGVMYLSLQMPNSTMEVEIGPRGFIENSGFALKIGENVTVIGVPATVGGREVVLAREISCSRATFAIRDRNGIPMWQTDRPVQMDTDLAKSNLG
jgi:hypothetical protein